METRVNSNKITIHRLLYCGFNFTLKINTTRSFVYVSYKYFIKTLQDNVYLACMMEKGINLKGNRNKSGMIVCIDLSECIGVICLYLLAAYPAVYGQFSQTIPQPISAVAPAQREGKASTL